MQQQQPNIGEDVCAAMAIATSNPRASRCNAYVTMSLQKLPCLLLANATATASGTRCCCT